MAITRRLDITYSDDPLTVWRVVWPTIDDNELSDPKWLTLGADAARAALQQTILVIVPVVQSSPVAGPA